MYFKASLDKLSIILTSIVSGIFVIITLLPFFIDSSTSDLTEFIIICTLWFTFIFCYLFRITGYTLNDSELIIHRPIFNKIVKRNTIKEIKKLNSDEINGMIRTFGNGGLFGFYGWFYNSKLGKIRLYCSRSNDLILLSLEKGKIVISPDETENFINASSK